MSNLYMTTEEFAAMIVDTLHDQNYFKKGKKNHPSDIAISFVSTAETIAATMEWAIKRVHDINLDQKMALLRTGNLSKNISGSLASASQSSEHVLPIDDEIAPSTIKSEETLVSPKDALEYSEWKMKGYL